MSSRRTAKVAEAIRETVSTTILFGLKDPRVKNVTVLDVEVSGDLRSAKVYVSVMGDERTQALSMHGLNSARGFLQSKVADRLQTRYTPILKFVLDQSVKRSIETSRVLRELEQERPQTATDEESPVSETDADLDDVNRSSSPDESAAEQSEESSDAPPAESDPSRREIPPE